MMGFSVESSEKSGDAPKATFDLTPFRERDKKLKQQQQQQDEEMEGRQTPKKSKSPRKSPHKKVKQTRVVVEDRKITEVKFGNADRFANVQDATRCTVIQVL